MTETTAALPPEVELWVRVAAKAVAWRRDHAGDPDRAELWDHYRHGAEWFGQDWQTRTYSRLVAGALDEAERTAAWANHDDR